MDRANNPSMPGLCMLSILGEVGLKNDGHLAAKRDCEVFVTFYLSCDPSLQPMFPCQHDPQIGSRAARPVPLETSNSLQIIVERHKAFSWSMFRVES
jgi:hypothetical protein